MAKGTTFLIAGLLGAIIILVLILVSRKNEVPKTPELVTQITQTQKLPSLEVTSIDPESSRLLEISSVTPITVAFNNAVTSSDLVIQLSPIVEITTEFSGNIVIIKPKVAWPIDQGILVSINRATSSERVYKFTLKAPKPLD